ncbi:bifunctional 3'-5' exonuclease/DNA polymerase [Microbacterium sp. cx-59]|uniref:bifunctional 3'-5' exonuclease/DNA polymerase n=1 Tax=Microbacterium sp. cx-59 TaxID=2891207 RepID=UPI0035ABDA14
MRWSPARSATASWYVPPSPGSDPLGFSRRPPVNPDAIRWSVIARTGAGALDLVDLDKDGEVLSRAPWVASEAASVVAARPLTRWVWADTARTYPGMLAAGVRVPRAWDLRLCHRILRSALPGAELGAERRWAGAATPVDRDDGLFAVDDELVPDADEVRAELRRQWRAVAAAPDPGRLRMLLHAESVGALIAEEMRAGGLPWDAAEHDRILVRELGERALPGGTPRRMQELAVRIRAELGDDTVSLDSPPKLLRALRRAGIQVASTSRWELAEHPHPAVEPLLEYKRLSRLLVASGWAWLDEWVHAGRFRPVYVPGGVVTGRWASSGGGALQIPRLLRPAVRPDPGWVVVDADVAQLEPRVLAAMSRDLALASAARGRDLYSGIVDSGAVATREEAKYAVLGAMYGATTGESGRLVPRLRRAYPIAMALVDDAAATGEDGGVVRTWLGRTSPPPELALQELSAAASAEGADAATAELARRGGRDRGRFTRNFVVQGSAAEWALCWLAEIRARLDALGAVTDPLAERAGPVFENRPHLVFFLHDEVMVHAPASMADAVVQAIRDAADAAGRRLFGTFPVDFPLDVEVVRDGASDVEAPGPG